MSSHQEKLQIINLFSNFLTKISSLKSNQKEIMSKFKNFQNYILSSENPETAFLDFKNNLEKSNDNNLLQEKFPPSPHKEKTKKSGFNLNIDEFISSFSFKSSQKSIIIKPTSQFLTEKKLEKIMPQISKNFIAISNKNNSFFRNIALQIFINSKNFSHIIKDITNLPLNVQKSIENYIEKSKNSKNPLISIFSNDEEIQLAGVFLIKEKTSTFLLNYKGGEFLKDLEKEEPDLINKIKHSPEPNDLIMSICAKAIDKTILVAEISHETLKFKKFKGSSENSENLEFLHNKGEEFFSLFNENPETQILRTKGSLGSKGIKELITKNSNNPEILIEKFRSPSKKRPRKNMEKYEEKKIDFEGEYLILQKEIDKQIFNDFQVIILLFFIIN